MDRKSLKKFIYLHAVIWILFLLYSSVLSYCSYMGGFTVAEPNRYFEVRFLLMLLFLPFLLVVFIYYIIILSKVGKKYISPSIALTSILFAIFFFTMSAAFVKFPARGYCDYVKNNVDIDAIHNWLVNYEVTEYEYVAEDGTRRRLVFEEDWPESIKTLNPSRGVLIFENKGKKYIRISHGVDIELSIGLCVMEEPMGVPEWGDDFNEKRIKLSDSTFVWAGD